MAAIATAGDPYTIMEPETVPSTRTGRPSEPIVPSARYELGDQLGRGGMGEVVVAHDVQIGREVAIKRLRHHEPSAQMMSRFLREARIQGRLEHPSIPPVYELAHDEQERPFFAMRKLEGVTLAETLREVQPRFTRQRLLRAFVDVCNAIELAHSRGIVHADLKPGNILLGTHGEVYVIDWGIARELGAPPPPTAMGTPGYMAPEQLRATTIDGRADVYSLGCLLFEVLTRRSLHPRGDAVASTLRGIEIEDPELPPELAEVCRRATRVERSDRLSSAREIGDAVQCYLDGDRDLARRRELAREHLATAHDALAAGDDDTHRSAAMREAGLALALDPELPGAAELVGRIMLETPRTTPAEVVHEVAEREQQEGRSLNKVSGFIGILHLLALPMFIALGIRDVAYLTAYTVLCLMMIGSCAIHAVMQRDRWWNMLLFLSGCVGMTALFARMFTPFIVAPGAGAVAIMTFAFDPRSRSRLVTALMTVATIGAVLGVYLAEVLGIVSPTTIRYDDHVVLRSPLEGIEGFPALETACGFVALLMLVASVGSHVIMREARRSRDQLHVHAWHLRQLIKR
ncbi:MAG TPA: serine/threonine-protein kinase [Kofleriaceae bacterium]